MMVKQGMFSSLILFTSSITKQPDTLKNFSMAPTYGDPSAQYRRTQTSRDAPVGDITIPLRAFPSNFSF